MNLPEKFLERMKRQLGEEFPAFLNSYEQKRHFGLRVNTLKTDPEEFERIAPFPVRKIPWISNGFFYGEGVYPARHPYYAAGIYYLQEPSAMTPASRLPVEPGERVLDLCAAPGGKATELAARLQGQGLLVANDISSSRAKALLRNLELTGAGNCLVTSEPPHQLARVFPEYFDKILVDAPCSGEGMFRKDPDVAGTWSEERVEYFAGQQRNILTSAAEMLRPGGMLLYSTCTFSPDENEGTITWFLERFPEFSLEEPEGYEGFSEGRPEWGGGRRDLKRCIRIWPHHMEGEGHFLALLRKGGEKNGEETLRPQKRQRPGREEKKLLETFLNAGGARLNWEQVEERGGRAYLVPELPESVKGIRFLRSGLYLGEFKKGRFEPSQPFAMSLGAEDWRGAVRLPAEDGRADRYLRGETLLFPETGKTAENGWKLVCVEKFSLGWGKMVNGALKNKYLCSWRKK